MRKNGLKWSNISVKKYHQSPGLGVRSGSVTLSLLGTLECSRIILGGNAYVDPHVCSTQFQLPQTSVDTKVRMTLYRPKFPNVVNTLFEVTLAGRGEANLDTGSVSNKRVTGMTNISDGSESCTRKAKANNVGEDCPVMELVCTILLQPYVITLWSKHYRGKKQRILDSWGRQCKWGQ